ncbi:hypothetical protein M2404_002812 [Rheinheimera pacifica]|uniref:hypothetical protein n=1 Tax=Rheinheimera pacifica TaxID=173990 RepID=UPI002167D6F1|nr:hypothetical protein [Rheinheimera pacifica]MCS4308455.1 hypothetical protein [Rheinheimera pacifica]
MKKNEIEASDSTITTRFFLLSSAVNEIIDLEEKISNEFRHSKQQFTSRAEYFSFWLRCQSFFVTAKSLTDCTNLNELYNKKSDADWRFGIKAIRHFFAHEIEIINSLHRAVTFITEEKRSISLTGFVVSSEDMFKILQKCNRNILISDFKKLKEKKKLNFKIMRNKLKKVKEKNLSIVNKIVSRPNPKVILISDIITSHYLLIKKIIDETRNISKTNSNSNTVKNKNKAINKEITYIENIEKIVNQAINYRNKNCNWTDTI